MGLHERLKTLRREAGGETSTSGPAAPHHAVDEADPEARLAALRARLDRLGGHSTPSRPQPRTTPAVATAELAERLGGRCLSDGLIGIERDIPATAEHGGQPLCSALHPAAPLLPSGARIGFLDTETTGLSGGTGTVAFLVGLVIADGQRLRLHQWLLTAFAGERALLEAADSVLHGCDHWVSYNGKSFDVPLLSDRRRLHGRSAAPTPMHTDLLHPVRSLFAANWPDCRLATAERRLLGVTRIDDLPGSAAPWAWKTYLQTGCSADLERVVAHNRDDILSLTLLAPHLARALCRPAEFGGSIEGAARARARLQGPEAAFATLSGGADQLSAEGELWLARECRRRGYWDQAVAIWQRLAETGNNQAIEALAKYYEHECRDWSRALRYAQRLPPNADSQRRQQRLLARLHNRR